MSPTRRAHKPARTDRSRCMIGRRDSRRTRHHSRRLHTLCRRSLVRTHRSPQGCRTRYRRSRRTRRRTHHLRRSCRCSPACSCRCHRCRSRWFRNHRTGRHIRRHRTPCPRTRARRDHTDRRRYSSRPRHIRHTSHHIHHHRSSCRHRPGRSRSFLQVCTRCRLCSCHRCRRTHHRRRLSRCSPGRTRRCRRRCRSG